MRALGAVSGNRLDWKRSMWISAFIAFGFEYARDRVFVCVCLCTPGVLAWGQMLCLTDKASKLLKATLWVGLLYHRGNPRTFPRFFFATSFGLSSWHWRDCLPHPPTHTHTETVISSLFSIKTPQYENQETVCPILRREKERELFKVQLNNSAWYRVHESTLSVQIKYF